MGLDSQHHDNRKHRKILKLRCSMQLLQEYWENILEANTYENCQKLISVALVQTAQGSNRLRIYFGF